MRSLKFVAGIGAILLLQALTAFALEYTTIESSVDVHRTTEPVTEKVVTITAPEGGTYRIEAPSADIDRIVEIVKDEPRSVISFNGEVVDRDGVQVFRVRNWRKVETTTTTTRTDADGNKVIEEKTETRHVPVP